MPLHEELAWIDAADEELLALHTALDELEACRANEDGSGTAVGRAVRNAPESEVYVTEDGRISPTCDV